MPSININGVTISAGKSIVIRGGDVIVDGVDVTPAAKTIMIEVNGDVNSVSVDSCDTFLISGNAGNVQTVSGTVIVHGAIDGNVKTVSGDVKSATIGGSVSTISGDVQR